MSKVQKPLLEHTTKDGRKEERQEAVMPRRRTANPTPTEVNVYIFKVRRENMRRFPRATDDTDQARTRECRTR
jgi:hypothetical protein